MSNSSTSKEKHANPNLPPINENKRSQFPFVSPQDKIGDKSNILVHKRKSDIIDKSEMIMHLNLYC